MSSLRSWIIAGGVIAVGVVAGVVAWKRGEAKVTPMPVGVEPTREASGFLDPENLEALKALMSPEKRMRHDQLVNEKDIPPDQARFMIIYGALPDRWSGDSRETEPFVEWVEGGTPMREEGEQSSDGYHRESRAIASMFQMGVAESLVGLSKDQRRRMLDQVRRWSAHYDDEIQGWGLFYLWVLKEKGETLPEWHERWLADGLKNEYWATKVELGRKAIDKARALRKGTPLER